jgi:ElaB/YqjD/DUF883 family membrane-anchored ribosome-binding protein
MFDPRTRGEEIAGRRDEEISGRAMDDRDRIGSAGSTASGTASPTASTSEIRRDIEQTRANINDTVDAIQQKLSAGNIVSKAKATVSDATRAKARQVADAAGETASHVADTTRRVTTRAVSSARENPWPAAAACAGAGALAWWLVSRRRDREGVMEFVDPEDLPVEDDIVEDDLYLADEFDFEDGEHGRHVGMAAGLAAIAGTGIGLWLWSHRAGRNDLAGNFPPDPDAWSDAGQYGADAGSYRSFEQADEDWRARGSEASSRVREAVSDAADRARHAMSSTRSRARGAMDEVRHRTRRLADRTSAQVTDASHRARNQLESLTQERPLAVGATALAVGVAVGMAVPISRAERRMMGNAREKAGRQARAMARNAIGNAKQTVKQTVEQVAERAKEAMDERARNSKL